MIRFFAVLAVFAWASTLQAQEPIKLDGHVEVVKVPQVVTIMVDRTIVKDFSKPLKLTVAEGGPIYMWQFPPGVESSPVFGTNVATITKAPKGELKVSVAWFEQEGSYDEKTKKVTIKNIPKAASITLYVGEVKPAPDPKPDPKPDPDPDPIPVGALRVIFVRESADNMTREQLNIWNSTQIAAYLNNKAVKDGTQPGWRKWDKDQSAAADPAMAQLWNDAKAKATTVLPAIIIAVGTQATIYPLPGTEAETLALLKKHAEGE